MELFDKVREFVVESFTKAGKVHQIKHFERTVYWVKELKSDADEALLISAMGHDIERAFRKDDMMEKKLSHGFDSKKFLRFHEERGAEILGDFLRKQGAEDSLIEKVKLLVSRHEEGGSDEQNLLRDADSVSFFENTVPYFLSDKKIKEVGIDNIKIKINWMYNRMTSERAKEIARGWYEGALEMVMR